MKFILICVFTLFSQSIYAQGTLEAELPDLDWFKKIKENSNFSINSQVGSASNIGKTPKAESGTFLKVAPNLGLDFMPRDELVISPMISGEFKRFNEKRASELGDEDLAEFRTMAIFFAESGDEWSMEGGHARVKSRIPIVDAQFITTPLLQKYFENDIRAGWLTTGETFEESLAFSLKEQKNDLSLQDRGNSYKNDFDSINLEAGLSAKFKNNFKLGFFSKLERKDYTFRPADFSDGAASPSDSLHPLLREEAQEHTIQGIFKFKDHELTTGMGLRLVKDRIFGARDSRSLRPKINLKSVWTDKLKTHMIVSVDQTQFQNFRVRPDLGERSELRKEWQFKTTLGSEWEISKSLSFLAQWDYSRLVTNFASGTYFEHIITTGIQWKL